MTDHRMEAESTLAAPGASVEQGLFAAAHALLAVEQRLGEIEGHLSAANADEGRDERAAKAMGEIADLVFGPRTVLLADIRRKVENAGWHR